jgi:excisionase family DNA binding protein
MTATVASGRSDGQTYLPARDQVELASIRTLLTSINERATTQRGPRLVDGNDNEVEIPAELVPVLLQVVEAMQAGLAVTVAPHHLTLSTQEAADLLRISRTTLVRLLENGEIPFDKPGRHRKVRLDDLMEYRRRQRHEADQALSDMVADSQRLGLYDAEPDDIRDALKQARKHRLNPDEAHHADRAAPEGDQVSGEHTTKRV